jgi:hypothetical protein
MLFYPVFSSLNSGKFPFLLDKLKRDGIIHEVSSLFYFDREALHACNDAQRTQEQTFSVKELKFLLKSLSVMPI